MGLFKKRKTLRETAKELYLTKSLQELSAMIGDGLINKTQPATVEEKSALVDAYLEKLVSTDVSDGGFGCKNIPAAMSVISQSDDFSWSIFQNGIHKRKSSFGCEVIENFRLEFLKNYILAGNTKPVQKDWFNLIFKVYDDTQVENTSNGMLTKNNLEDIKSPIYNKWVYEGNDSDFILYKIKVAISFCDSNFVKRYGLVKGGAAEKTTSDFVENAYITFDDIVKFNSKYEVENFLNDCQTIG
ncbi:MAG: hypothetical protein K2H78_00590 [Clostridia bacterium]|nr:hypothetical protein [Clostridia bacterium]